MCIRDRDTHLAKEAGLKLGIRGSIAVNERMETSVPDIYAVGDAVAVSYTHLTVQEIYKSARRKIAACLVHGKPLHITGGNYRICVGQEVAHCGRCCRMQRANTEKSNKNCKGDPIMKIAVTYENDQIFQHFGHTEQFKLYEAVDGKIVHAEVVDTNGSGHGALAGFLMQHGVDTLICGGIGGGAQAALAEAGIKLYGGVSGDADVAVNALLSGNLGYNPNVHCDHHDQMCIRDRCYS